MVFVSFSCVALYVCCLISWLVTYGCVAWVYAGYLYLLLNLLEFVFSNGCDLRVFGVCLFACFLILIAWCFVVGFGLDLHIC